MSNYRRIIGPAIALVTVLWAIPARAAEPLHARIDQLIAAATVGPASPIANDAEFLRRVYLDLTGEIPSPAAAREFLDDKSPEKRTALVDRLLAGPAYPRHMAGVFSVMLMERRADKVIPQPNGSSILRASLAANKPYNQLAREILAADGVDSALRPAAKFYLDRDGDPNLLTRDVGRIFFGRDFQCAQCHDHPIIDSYYQADYYGLFACFNRGALFTDPKDKKVFFAEKGEGGVAFQSVFDTDAKGNTRPRLPGGAAACRAGICCGRRVHGKARRRRAAGAEVQPPRTAGRRSDVRREPRVQREHRQSPVGAYARPRAGRAGRLAPRGQSADASRAAWRF